MAKSALPFGSNKQAPATVLPPAKQITHYSQRYKEEQTARPICTLPIIWARRTSLLLCVQYHLRSPWLWVAISEKKNKRQKANEDLRHQIQSPDWKSWMTFSRCPGGGRLRKRVQLALTNHTISFNITRGGGCGGGKWKMLDKKNLIKMHRVLLGLFQGKMVSLCRMGPPELYKALLMALEGS